MIILHVSTVLLLMSRKIVIKMMIRVFIFIIKMVYVGIVLLLFRKIYVEQHNRLVKIT
jgi:hypothetical protein